MHSWAFLATDTNVDYWRGELQREVKRERLMPRGAGPTLNRRLLRGQLKQLAVAMAALGTVLVLIWQAA